MPYLVEDRMPATSSYADFILALHNEGSHEQVSDFSNLLEPPSESRGSRRLASMS